MHAPNVFRLFDEDDMDLLNRMEGVGGALVEALHLHKRVRSGVDLLQDISLRIRELPKHEQIKLVDIFFKGQRFPLLGEMEPGPWQTTNEFFAAFMSGRGVRLTRVEPHSPDREDGYERHVYHCAECSNVSRFVFEVPPRQQTAAFG